MIYIMLLSIIIPTYSYYIQYEYGGKWPPWPDVNKPGSQSQETLGSHTAGCLAQTHWSLWGKEAVEKHNFDGKHSIFLETCWNHFKAAFLRDPKVMWAFLSCLFWFKWTLWATSWHYSQARSCRRASFGRMRACRCFGPIAPFISRFEHSSTFQNLPPPCITSETLSRSQVKLKLGKTVRAMNGWSRDA